jgi:hypothetical protein
MARDSKTMEVLRRGCNEGAGTFWIYDALAAAGCLLTPEARDVIDAAEQAVDRWGIDGSTNYEKVLEKFHERQLVQSVRAYRAATEPPKYVAENRNTYSNALSPDGDIVAQFYGETHRADCEAWVAAKNATRP